jgi:hypothetical protein
MAAALQADTDHADAYQFNRRRRERASPGLRRGGTVAVKGDGARRGRRAADPQEIASLQVAHRYLGGVSIIVDVAGPGKNGEASPFNHARY